MDVGLQNLFPLINVFWAWGYQEEFLPIGSSQSSCEQQEAEKGQNQNSNLGLFSSKLFIPNG